MSVLDDVVQYIDNKISEASGDEREQLIAAKECILSGGPREARRRAPSEYNLFLKDCIRRARERNEWKQKPITEVFSFCVSEYKKRKK